MNMVRAALNVDFMNSWNVLVEHTA